jgi:transcriptional regulator with XRE-family HTH domain
MYVKERMPPNIPPTLGRRVADCRERLGWTQKTLAESAHLSVTFISEIENDRRVPGTEALLALANALGSSLDYLVKGASEAPPPRRPLVIPPELGEAAEEGHWSLPVASDLVRFRDMVVARRSRGGEADEAGRTLSKDDWKEMYVAYQRFFGAENDGSTRS